MKAHLLRSAELDPELFLQVIDLLKAIPGPITFSYMPETEIDFNNDELFIGHIPDSAGFEKSEEPGSPVSANCIRNFPMDRPTADWPALFKKCSQYRRQQLVPDDEFILLLTDIANNKNWFAYLDEEMPFNGFIHTADWDHFINCSPAFPIAYEVVALMIQKHMFREQADLHMAAHREPVGCVNDLCIQKREIILKLRTADICRSCMERIRNKIHMPVLHHALAIMESLRVKMLYAQNFRQESPPSRLLIDSQKRIFLPDYGNIEIRLRPLEKSLYFLFLRHPDGIFLSSLSDFRQELYEIYSGISQMGMLSEMRERIDDMVNALSNSASEKISRIKRVFEESIGVELARHYYIRGNTREAKKITLERILVTGMG